MLLVLATESRRFRDTFAYTRKKSVCETAYLFIVLANTNRCILVNAIAQLKYWKTDNICDLCVRIGISIYFYIDLLLQHGMKTFVQVAVSSLRKDNIETKITISFRKMMNTN